MLQSRPTLLLQGLTKRNNTIAEFVQAVTRVVFPVCFPGVFRGRIDEPYFNLRVQAAVLQCRPWPSYSMELGKAHMALKGRVIVSVAHYLMLFLNNFFYPIIFLDFIFFGDRLGQNCSHNRFL
jgi:hypothetical protein